MRPDAPKHRPREGRSAKLLVLSPVFPDGPGDGDRLRLGHWLGHLAPRHEVHLACFADPSRPGDWTAGAWSGALAAVHRVAWPLWRRRLAAGGRLAGPLPSSVAAERSPAMAGLVEALVRDAARQNRPFGGVLAYRLKMAPYALRFRGPRFLDYTDAMTRWMERRAVDLALRGRWASAAWARRQAELLAAYEGWCAGEFDAGFFNARQDCEAVQAMHPGAAAKLAVASNGVDAASFRRPAGPRAVRPGQEMLFVGNLAYGPNAQAVDWFVRAVLPLVRVHAPGAHLTVVGGGAPPGLTRLARFPGVRFEGPVPDTRPHLWRADLSVCPVQTGAGRQNKLLEAFAAGLPAVATPLAAGGAEAVHGVHAWVAGDAQGFADGVLRLLRRPQLGRRLALNARTLALRAYDWSRNASVLEGAMLEAMRRPLW